MHGICVLRPLIMYIFYIYIYMCMFGIMQEISEKYSTRRQKDKVRSIANKLGAMTYTKLEKKWYTYIYISL